MQTYELEPFLSEQFPIPPDLFCCTTVHGFYDPRAGPLLWIFSRRTASATQQDEDAAAKMREITEVGRLKIVVVDAPLSYEKWKNCAWDEAHASAVITELLAVTKFDHRLMLLNSSEVFLNDEMYVARLAIKTGRDFPAGTVSEICAHCWDVLTFCPQGDRAAIRQDMMKGPHSGYR
jgi:hypothetical protein